MTVRTHRQVDLATYIPVADVEATSPHGFHIFVFFGSCRCDQGGQQSLLHDFGKLVICAWCFYTRFCIDIQRYRCCTLRAVLCLFF